MDQATIGALLLSVLGGSADTTRSRLREGVEALVRRPFHPHQLGGASLVSSGEEELAALIQAPSDERRALALAEALVGRAEADAKFMSALTSWWADASPVVNLISGGIYYSPVLQAHRIDATFQTVSAAPVALAQLPPQVVEFTGRGEELAAFTDFLNPAAQAAAVSALAGLPGVGKTALAIAAGYALQERGWYGGGVLFIDLHGYDEAQVEPGQALDALLRALGVAVEHIPPGTEARSGLYPMPLSLS